MIRVFSSEKHEPKAVNMFYQVYIIDVIINRNVKPLGKIKLIQIKANVVQSFNVFQASS
jgi:hypothetical protein